MFEVEVADIEPFRNLVKAIDAVVEEGCFDIDGEKIRLLAMDPPIQKTLGGVTLDV